MSETTQQELERTIQYPVAIEAIEAMAREYLPLKIMGVLDKEGQATVREARLDVKRHRVAVEHKRKELKADALEYGRKVDSAAKLLTGKLTEIESHLIAEEAAVKEEIDRIAREEKDRRAAVLRDRMERLLAVECMVSPVAIEAMSDEQFETSLAGATECYREKLAEREAEQRRREAEEAERKREAEEAEQARRVEEERLAAERKKLEAEKAELEAEKRLAEEALREVKRREAAEAERKALEERQKHEAEEERRRQKRLEAMRPDLERLGQVLVAIRAIDVPELLEKEPSTALRRKRESICVILYKAAERIEQILEDV